jgi:hypothetical protein
MQHYVIRFVTDLRFVGGFQQVLRFPPPLKLTATIYLQYYGVHTKQDIDLLQSLNNVIIITKITFVFTWPRYQ